MRTLLAVILALTSGLALAENRSTVALDVGHSLKAPGAISASGRTEFSFNQQLARAIAFDLQAQGLHPKLIGDAGDMEHLTDRTRLAQGQDLFISLHHDSVQPQYLSQASRFHGYSLFVSRKNPYPLQSLSCARQIAYALQSSNETPSLHHAEPIRGENRPLADAALGIYWFDDLLVLKTARQPAVLIESGVIVNPREELRLTDPATHKALAAAEAQGIARCLAKLAPKISRQPRGQDNN